MELKMLLILVGLLGRRNCVVFAGTTPARNKVTDSVEPRESFGLGQNEDSRPSKIVLPPYFLACVPCGATLWVSRNESQSHFR